MFSIIHLDIGRQRGLAGRSKATLIIVAVILLPGCWQTYFSDQAVVAGVIT
jgi:hypothetical protein